jgi:hypothetical protein
MDLLKLMFIIKWLWHCYGKSISHRKLSIPNERNIPLDIIKPKFLSPFQFWFWRRRFLKKKNFCPFLGPCGRAHGRAQAILWYFKGTIPTISDTRNGVIKWYISWNISFFKLKINKIRLVRPWNVGQSLKVTIFLDF